MNKMTEEELLSIIERYGYELQLEDNCGRAVNPGPGNHTNRMPLFAGSKYNILKHIVARILEKEND